MPHIVTPNGTLSFPTVFQPKPRAKDGEPVYSAVLIFNPTQQKSPLFAAMKEACEAAAIREWGDKVRMKEVKMPFRDAGEKAGSWGGFNEGDIFISPWSKSKPGLVDKQREEIFAPEDVWAGQTVRMSLSPYAWENTGRKGVSFALNHIQILDGSGPRIDGRVSARDAFNDDVSAPDGADIF